MLLGLGASIPLGPINTLIMNTALSNARNAFAIGLGAMSADLSYLGIVLLGFHLFLASPLVENLIAFLGSLFLLYLAYLFYKGRNKSLRERATEPCAFFKSLIKGYLLTLSNPYTIAFWLSVASLVSSPQYRGIWLVLGIALVIFTWTISLPLLIHKSKHLISERVTYFFSLFSALIMVWFALMLWVRIWLSYANPF